MTSFISWNCRGLRTRLTDLKSIISTYQPACVALQETFLKSTMTMQVRGYNCVRRDVDGDTSPTGGVCLFTSNLFPSNVVTLHTSLQAVAVRIHVHSLVTVCCVYLPPNDVVPQVDLNHLVSQLPAPFILLGDFNGHSPLWGHDVTNSRGRQIEQLISDHCLCLLNNDEKTYFHAPTRTFHSLDLAICSPTLLPMLNFEVANDLHNSDHFPLLVSHVNAIPKTSNSPRKLCKPWWNASCQQAKKEQRRAWGIFRRYPTTDNLIAFKRAKALARRIRRQCQRESWIQYVSSITSSTTSQQLWRKVKAANGLYRDFNIPILETSTALYSSPLDVANLIGKTFASVSSSDSYSPAFQATKNRLERTPINFRCRQPLPYNCDFDMLELKRALSSAHNTSPGPDGISYELLRHLNEDSLVSLLYLFNRIWREQVYPTQWQEAIVIPILRPGKDPKNPLSYRPIALTSCLCKTLERMVNARFVYELEKNKCIPLFQSGFRKGRSTLDNIIQLESKIRNAFVRRNHLVSIFFDIEKAYDRTWRYGILRTVRLGGTLSAPFTQAEGVPQGSILSVTLFICHISSILNILSPSIQASLYVDDLQISCEGSDMRMIERQLQTAVNNILKWCDTNGHSISASKSCCVHFCRKRGIHPDPEIRIRDIQIPVVPDVRFLGVIFDRRLTFLPHILHLRKKCEKSLNLLKVLSNTSWGADRTSLLRVYQAIVLSRIDYGCVAYGSACNSTLQKLDPVHHMALRICSGAFRTSPVQSLYVNCHQLPLDLRRRKLSLAYYFKILSVPSHPLQNVYMSTSMKRLYDARPSNIRPFMDRMKLHISELDLPNVHIQQRNLFLFQPWNTPRFPYINPFATYSKSTVAPVVFQRVFAYHRSQYSRYSAIYTDGSKRADYVGCGVVIEDIMHGYRLDTSCSIFTAEAVAIYRALQLIDSTMPRKYCIYTDSMSVLEALENYHDRCHPVVCTILDITSRLYSKGFDIVFCWLPSHVGIIGNEQADSAAKSATTHLPLAVPLSDMKRVIMHHIFKIWQESWSQQLDNKLHSVKPVIGAWPVMPMRRTDVKLTRLRIGHTRFTHRHLLFGERAPECPSCHVSYTVHHILIDCPVFNTHRITFFHKSVLTLSDLVGESPHQNLFAFIRRIGFLYLI
ncbi:probable RNA-directed DNA polymerase from transposon X-element [Trichonephila clavipes]|uniref:Probable RNA-directed DNA polymerase from transposon X-element n=2 Tax=Trichonephila clavipes TaxID=2585209 RepID=A0A8X7BIU1_TRICX|nr:probable RNA-directed DNA polymerase from transposon X-element [Trichonephila clavipes]